jgi:hypothetical protein
MQIALLSVLVLCLTLCNAFIGTQWRKTTMPLSMAEKAVVSKTALATDQRILV